MVGAAGFEPATFCTPCNCATELRHAPNSEPLCFKNLCFRQDIHGRGERIRTSDPLVPNQVR